MINIRLTKELKHLNTIVYLAHDFLILADNISHALQDSQVELNNLEQAYAYLSSKPQVAITVSIPSLRQLASKYPEKTGSDYDGIIELCINIDQLIKRNKHSRINKLVEDIVKDSQKNGVVYYRVDQGTKTQFIKINKVLVDYVLQGHRVLTVNCNMLEYDTTILHSLVIREDYYLNIGGSDPIPTPCSKDKYEILLELAQQINFLATSK